MEIITAKEMGFCFGVKRVVDLLNDLLKKHKTVYVYGELIHNPPFLKKKEKEGMILIKNLGELKNLDRENSIILSRAHGIKKEEYEVLKQFKYFYDGTCPYVSVIHKQGEILEKEYLLLILGDKNHPETQAAISYLKNFILIENPEDVFNFKDILKKQKIAVLIQTTQSLQNVKKLINNLLDLEVKDFRLVNTRCGATEERQKAVIELCNQNPDLIIVIGGKNSANTRRLFQLASQCVETHHIESKEELKKEWFKNKNKIGITAGASTPDYIIEEIINEIKSFEKIKEI